MSIVVVQGFGMYDETTATEGAPGSFADRTPANFTDLTGTTASPATKWTAGDYVALGDASHAFWDGAAWRVGDNVAPTLANQTPPATGTTTVVYGPYTFTATGDAPITWAVTSGALPNGLTLGTDGVLSGTPTVAAAFTFKVTATNYTGLVQSANKTITIS